MLSRDCETKWMKDRIAELEKEHQELKAEREALYIKLKAINKEKLRLQMKLNLG